MKILFYTDIHANWSYPDYMNYLDKTVDYLIEQIETHKPDLVVNLGDTMDTFGTVDVHSMVWASRTMARITEHAAKYKLPGAPAHWIIKGNHDISDSAGQYSSTEVLIRDKRSQHFIDPDENAYETGIAVLPYTSDPSKASAFLQKIGQKKLVCVCSHIDWIGMHLTPSWVSKHGVSVSDYERLVGTHTPCFNGHYHNPVNCPPLYIVGAPLYKDFNDSCDQKFLPRGFVLYDSDKKLITRIVNPNTYYMASVRIETEEDLLKLAEITNPKQFRVKLYTTTALLELVKEYCKKMEFLWSSVYPSDSNKQQVKHTTQVSITSSADEVVSSAVSAADPAFDKVLLRQYGDEAFGMIK